MTQKRQSQKVAKKKSRFQDSDSEDSSNDESKEKSASDDSEEQVTDEEAELSEEHKIGLNVFEEYF